MKKFLSFFLLLTIIIFSGCTSKSILTNSDVNTGKTKAEGQVIKGTNSLNINTFTDNGKIDSSDESLKNDVTIIPSVKPEPSAAAVKPQAVVSVAKPQPLSSSKGTNKTVYLTIDDGPSSTTGEILDILDKYKVKATFFVTAQNYPRVKGMYAEIKKRGHTIGAHSYTHSYSIVYASVTSFFNDMDRLDKILLAETGEIPNILRFPGGSNNHTSWQYSGKDFMRDQLIPAVLKKGYVYFDWNSVGNDAVVANPSKDYIINQVFSTTAGLQNVIVLLHDSNIPGTLAALPVIIQRFQSEGYTFKVLTKTSYNVQFTK